MRFALAPGVERFREEVRAFLEEHGDPVIALQGPFPQRDTPEKRAFVAKLAERGWLGLAWPVRYGGRGWDGIYQLVLQEELEYAGHPSMAIEVGMIGPTVLRHGSEAMKRWILPRIVAGDVDIALGYSEPDAGSDLAALRLRAEPDGDGFVLNGQKMWTSAAHFAELIWLACRTNPAAGKHGGISLLLVDLDSPGIEVRPVPTMADHQANAVFFSDVRVPGDRLVGEVDRGWSYILEALDYERLGGLPFGGLQRDLDEIVAFAREAGWFDDPAARRRVARMAVAVDGARTHLLRAYDRMSRQEIPGVEAAMLKVAMTELRQAIADDMVEILGPAGLLRGSDPEAPIGGRFEHNWRSEIITTIAAGANEVQRDLLARHHLRLPSARRR
ncbi:MAG TPA: acyl-CoA dehydrogenase family protein [Acidimicrobiia bacterium]|nr:acyl-CoA dehydrogenase family protein [Acidimicrobiia bacterium]